METARGRGEGEQRQTGRGGGRDGQMGKGWGEGGISEGNLSPMCAADQCVAVLCSGSCTE